MHQYGIISEGEQKLWSKKLAGIRDPAKRRELKIKQYKAEQEIRGNLEASNLASAYTPLIWYDFIQLIQKRKGQSLESIGFSDDFGLVASMLPLPNPAEEYQHTDDDETLRDIFLLAIRLTWVLAQSHLESMEQELELLHNAPPLETEQSKTSAPEDATWKLDLPSNMGGPDGRGPLMDSSGRVS